jgi:hypothetical protein
MPSYITLQNKSEALFIQSLLEHEGVAAQILDDYGDVARGINVRLAIAPSEYDRVCALVAEYHQNNASESIDQEIRIEKKPFPFARVVYWFTVIPIGIGCAVRVFELLFFRSPQDDLKEIMISFPIIIISFGFSGCVFGVFFGFIGAMLWSMRSKTNRG